MPRTILGLVVNDRNTSAALVVDGQLLCAVQEERLNREKLTRRFPERAMRWCLSRAGLRPRDVDAVAISVNPAIYLEHLSPAQSERARFRGELLYSPANYWMAALEGRARGSSELTIPLEGAPDAVITYVPHHDCHAATAFYLSPFRSAAVLTIDGFGEKDTTCFYRGEGNRLEPLERIEFPHSVGMFYAAMTEYLGLRPFHDEWKLMAAASAGDAGRLYSRLRPMLLYTGPGRFEVDLSYFNYYQFGRPRLFAEKLVGLLGPPYGRDARPDQRFFDTAAAAQRVTEECVLRLLDHLATQVPSENLCLAGGVAMNCVLNGKVASRTRFRHLFVPPMPDDSGAGIGAALYVHHAPDDARRSPPLIGNDLGPAFSDAEIEAELSRARLRYRRVEDAPASAAAGIARGQLVGWFQGGTEFGDRALGHRSVLADPRDATVPGRLAAVLKERADYQPFAPAVLEACAQDYFEMADPSPFMETTVPVRPERRREIPAVVARDGSARVQTVSAARNERFHRLLTAFRTLTGVPLVLNTSFNLSGEPMVCTPRDALRTFYSSGLDALYLGSFVIEK